MVIYFNIHNDRYDILPGDLPFMLSALEKNIPIFFVINKCPDNILDNEDEIEFLRNEVTEARQNRNPEFKESSSFFINCLKGKGFSSLLKGIYSYYKKYIIKDSDLSEIKIIQYQLQILIIYLKILFSLVIFLLKMFF